MYSKASYVVTTGLQTGRKQTNQKDMFEEMHEFSTAPFHHI